MSLIKNIKKNRPTVSVGLLKQLGFPGLSNATDSDLGFEHLLDKIMFAAGINHIVQVNDCEDNTGYTESDNGTFDLGTFAATGKRVGTNCLLMTETAACDNSQYIDITSINESTILPKRHGKRQMDWSDTKYLGFWIHNASDTGAFGTAGEMQVAIVSDGVLQTKMPVQACVDAVHQWFQIDMEAAGWDLTKVESLRFYCNNANTGETFYVDDILRYQISYNDAPLYGCAFPIKSGETVTNGDNVRWTVDGITAGDGTQVVNDLGMGEVFGASLVGTGKRDKWVMVPGIHICIARMSAVTTAGEGLIFSAATTMEGCSTGVDEIAVAKGLEGAGAANDDIFIVRGLGNHFIG